MTKLELNLDSTVLSHSSCMRRLAWKVIDGYTEPLTSSNIIYGVAVHKFIDEMYQTKGNIAAALTAATKAFNVPKLDKARQGHLSDERHMIASCMTVWEQWIKKDTELAVLQAPDGSPMTEVSFSIPFYEDDTIKVNLCGTIDTIGKINNGVYCIRDWKTTSAWDGKEYFSQYELNRQLRIYALAIKLMAKSHPDSIFGTIGAGKIGAVIDGLFVKAAISECNVKRSEVFLIGDEETNEMHSLITTQCRELSFAIKSNTFPKTGLLNGTCVGKYGKCLFWNCCKVRPEIVEILLKREFKQKAFNPLTYNSDTE